LLGVVAFFMVIDILRSPRPEGKAHLPRIAFGGVVLFTWGFTVLSRWIALRNQK
jgi:hypothetical protein